MMKPRLGDGIDAVCQDGNGDRRAAKFDNVAGHGRPRHVSWRSILPLAVAAFFVFGGIGNLIQPGSVSGNYLRWGYPGWFHLVTSAMELTTAALLASAGTRRLGAALGCLVMTAAAATVTTHGEYGEALLPAAILFLTAGVGLMARRTAAAAR